MNTTTQQVITRAKIRLGLMDSTYADVYLEKFIEEGARHLDALSIYTITCETLHLDCNRASLPDNIKSMYDVICMQFPGTDGSCCGACASVETPNTNPAEFPDAGVNAFNNTVCGCGNWFIPDRNVLTNFCGLGANAFYCGNTFDITGGYLVFPSTITATEVKIWYKGYNINSDGLMVLSERQERGLSAYAAFNYAMSGQNYKAYNNYQISKWEREWVAQKNWLRGKDVEEDARLHKADLSAICRAILLNPLMSLDRNG